MQKALLASILILPLLLAAEVCSATPDPTDLDAVRAAPAPAPAHPAPQFGPLPGELPQFGPLPCDFVYLGPPLPASGPEQLGPRVEELRDVRGLLPGQITPVIWPTVEDAQPALAGPPTPAEEPRDVFAGPPTPVNVPIPCGPPVPPSEVPTAYGFVWPVGGEDAYQQPDEKGEPGFRVVRGYMPGFRRGDRHMGVDLSNRQSGSVVRALADGVVALVSDRSKGDAHHTGWGNLIVLAHRLPGGEVVYSLLAHLKDRSIRVRPGDRVTAGEPIAEVGSTGHSDGPHLHLEIRKYLNWNALDLLPQGWQHMGFLNPIGFLSSHLVHFPDLPENHWAYPYVMPLVRMGVLHAGSTFVPDQPVTPAEFADILSRAFGEDAVHSVANRPGDQPLPLSAALTWLQDVLTPSQSDPGVDARNHDILVRSLEQATGRRAPNLDQPLTRAQAAVLVKAALSADNREPAATK